jgi:ankyrin repeat protein
VHRQCCGAPVTSTLDDTMRWGEYERIFEVLKRGQVAELEAEAVRNPTFPEGVDDYIGRRWIINAIDAHSTPTVEWMLRKRVDLDFSDDEGYTPVHTAIDRKGANHLEVLKLLLEAGAPVNLKGINDWTPAHMAVARDDVEALKLLVKFGADLSIRTEIDNYETPIEAARRHRRRNVLRYLESVV